MYAHNLLAFLLMSCCVLFARAETINIGSDKKIEVIDGTIKESTATDALKYLSNTYSRQGSVTDALSTILRYYRGPLEADFLLLYGKSWLLDAYQLSPEGGQARKQYSQYGGRVWNVEEQLNFSYNTFLKLYDGHRNHKIVRNGELIKTIDKAISALLKEPVFGFKDRMSYRWLDNLLKFGALRIYIAGTPSTEIEKYIREPYTKRISWDSSMLKKGNPFVESGKYYALAAEKEGGPAFCGYPKKEVISAAIFMNMLSLAAEAEARARYINGPIINIYGGEGTCYYWKLKPFAGANYGLFGRSGATLIADGKQIKEVYQFVDLIKGNSQKSLNFDLYISCGSCSGKPFTISGSWSGNLGFSGKFNENGLLISDVDVGQITINSFPLIDHIMENHGNVYDWVGLKRSVNSNGNNASGGLL